jgi:endonuclease/exonuclease/phosphatase family metal-dependent hydrolase
VAHLTIHGKDVVYLNTHLDDQSNDQRALGASMILLRAKYEVAKTGVPVIVTGDFNR